MSSDKSFKQDVVVSIRYRNDLPPPPMPPKFLDIDTGGINQYLTTSYASSLARREEPTIDVDAEGGMPIDMIGVPGYFLGDESAIMAPDTKPILDPADQALMMSYEDLKRQGARDNVSFLRKTQYMSSTQMSRPQDPRTMKATPQKARQPLQPRPNAQSLDHNSLDNIKRHIQKGFDIAYPDSVQYNSVKSQPATPVEREAWQNPRHPDNPRLRPVGYYPIIPDFEAVGGFSTAFFRLKYDKPPLSAHHGKRDARADMAVFDAVRNETLYPSWKASHDAYHNNKEKFEDPGMEPHYWVMSVPKNADDVPKLRKALYEGHPDKEKEELLESVWEESPDGEMRIPFERRRVYANAVQAETDDTRFMGLGIYDPESKNNPVPPTKQKRKQGPAAYFYPIREQLRLKADRGKLDKRKMLEMNLPLEERQKRMKTDQDVGKGEEGEVFVDMMFLKTRQLDKEDIVKRDHARGSYDETYRAEYERLAAEVEAEQAAAQAQAEADEEAAGRNGEREEDGGVGDISMQEARARDDEGPATNGVRGLGDGDADLDADMDDE